jgi:hypothetical protein
LNGFLQLGGFLPLYNPVTEPQKIKKYPTKLWSVEVFLLDEAGTQVEANVFS